MAKGGSFRTGALGSPFSTEYQGDEGMNLGAGGQPSERGPKVGAGKFAERVTTEFQRDGGKYGKGKGGKGSVEA